MIARTWMHSSFNCLVGQGAKGGESKRNMKRGLERWCTVYAIVLFDGALGRKKK